MYFSLYVFLGVKLYHPRFELFYNEIKSIHGSSEEVRKLILTKNSYKKPRK